MTLIENRLKLFMQLVEICNNYNDAEDYTKERIKQTLQKMPSVVLPKEIQSIVDQFNPSDCRSILELPLFTSESNLNELIHTIHYKVFDDADTFSIAISDPWGLHGGHNGELLDLIFKPLQFCLEANDIICDGTDEYVVDVSGTATALARAMHDFGAIPHIGSPGMCYFGRDDVDSDEWLNALDKLTNNMPGAPSI